MSRSPDAPILSVKGLVELIVVTHDGLTVEEFNQLATDWLATAKHRRFQRPYTDCVYQPMLQWTAAGSGLRFCLYVHHTDAERESAYHRAAATGRLDKGLDEATRRGWTVADMKRDWKRVFPFERKRATLQEPPQYRKN